MPTEKLNVKITDSLSFQMILIKGSEFIMGDKNSKHEDEKNEHRVVLDDFYLGQYPVTQELWQAIMKENPSSFKGANRPVETVSWGAVQRFLKQLNMATSRTFRLPTEAEWEYAGRGGVYSQGYAYSGSDKLKQVGWYNENSRNETRDVGLSLANELGLYDMSGNVYEWCDDRFSVDYYLQCLSNGVVRNPVNTEGDRCVVRGGSFFSVVDGCRIAFRNGFAPDDIDGDVGFRLCLPMQLTGMLPDSQ
ncbi:MAG: formylglycine-generating enzyme family protein [Planctomycetota bacterium]